MKNKIIITIISIIITISLLLIINNFISNNDFDEGTITIIIDYNNEKDLESYVIDLEEKTSILDILMNHSSINISCGDNNYNITDSCEVLPLINSVLIMEINDVSTNWNDTYYAIYVNNQYSTLGVSLIYPSKGDVIMIKKLEVK